MPLSGFRASVDFSQWSLSNKGIPRPTERLAIWDGEAVRAVFARANAVSSAAAELRKIIGVPLNFIMVGQNRRRARKPTVAFKAY